MKQKIIYAVFLAAIATMAYFLYQQNKEIKDLETVLEQCSDRYYQQIKKIKTSKIGGFYLINLL